MAINEKHIELQLLFTSPAAFRRRKQEGNRGPSAAPTHKWS